MLEGNKAGVGVAKPIVGVIVEGTEVVLGEDSEEHPAVFELIEIDIYDNNSKSPS